MAALPAPPLERLVEGGADLRVAGRKVEAAPRRERRRGYASGGVRDSPRPASSICATPEAQSS